MYVKYNFVANHTVFGSKTCNRIKFRPQFNKDQVPHHCKVYLNTLDTLEAFIAETYVQLATTELRATLLADLLSLESADQMC